MSKDKQSVRSPPSRVVLELHTIPPNERPRCQDPLHRRSTLRDRQSVLRRRYVFNDHASLSEIDERLTGLLDDWSAVYGFVPPCWLRA